MKRSQLYLFVGLLVVLVVAALIYFATTTKTETTGKYAASFDNKPVPAGLLSQLQISNNVSNAVGIGVASKTNVKALNNQPLTVNGKPEMLYIGAEYCPYCAAERWGMVIALMRFGSFSGLRLMTSDPNDYSPNTPTFTFYNSTYSSPYIYFVPVELTTNNQSTLQTPNDSESYLLAKYDPNGGIPYILFANKTILLNANYDPYSIIDTKNWTVIAQELHNASTVQSLAIVGTANLITAQICIMDNNTPSSVCSQPYVKNIEGSTPS